MGRFLLDFVEFILLVLFLRVLVRSFTGLFGSPGTHRGHPGTRERPPSVTAERQGEMARDPVCGMFVSTELSHPLRQGTATLHFCSRGCLEKYQKQVKIGE